MPLPGDTLIGLSGLWVAYSIARNSGTWVWTAIVTWNAVAIWDALSVFTIHKTSPWPEFFMVELLGSSMLFIAALMHLAVIVLVSHHDVKSRHLVGC